MKVAMIGHKRVPSREGGVEVVVGALSLELSRLGANIFLYNRYRKGIVQQKEYNGIPIVVVPTIETRSLDATIYSFLASVMCKKEKPDIVHYHALGPSVALLIPRLSHCKTVVTVHGLNYKSPKWSGFGSWYIKLGERIAARYADSIIVLTKEMQNYFKSEYKRDAVLIPNGVNLGEITQPHIIYSKWGLSRKSFVLAVSRLVPGKGLENLIAAYKLVSTDYPLVIAGDSGYMPEYKESLFNLARDDKRVIFLGSVDNKMLDELYSNAALFVLPSEAEGLPMCLLEAMGYNCPCLVSNIPENIEIVGGLGRVFKVDSVENLRNEIQDMIDFPTEVETREYILEKYNWGVVAKRTMEVYESLQ